MLYKATGASNVNKWYWFLHAILWADRISIRKRLGQSPYYLITGSNPILLLDLKEATYLTESPGGVLTESELIRLRARAIAKHRIHIEQMKKKITKDKLRRLEQFEKDYKAVIKDYAFKPGDLVLVRNTAIEKSLDKKMKPRYTGPMIVVHRDKGGSYILAELSGAVWQQKVAQFRVIPYFARKKIDLPDGILSIIDLTKEELDKLVHKTERTTEQDYLLEDIHFETESGNDPIDTSDIDRN